MPETPIKTVRIPPDLREAVRKVAQSRATSESQVIREALYAYLDPKPQQKEQAK